MTIAPGTPLPWRLEDCSVHPEGDDDGVRFYDIQGGEECRSPFPKALSGYIACGGDSVAHVMKSPAYGPANAAYIVEACNAYPTLLAQRDALVEALEEARHEVVATMRCVTASDGLAEMAALVAKWDAALAQAKGETK